MAILQECIGNDNPSDPYSLQNVLAFFKTLPVWLDTDNHIPELTPKLAEDRTLSDVLLLPAATNDPFLQRYRGTIKRH